MSKNKKNKELENLKEFVSPNILNMKSYNLDNKTTLFFNKKTSLDVINERIKLHEKNKYKISDYKPIYGNE